MSRRRSHCNSRISGKDPAREPDSKRPVDVPMSPRPRPSGPGVQCRPVQSSLITGLHHPMAGNSNTRGTVAAAGSQDRNTKTCQLDQPNARLSGRDLSQLPTLARQSRRPTRFLETRKEISREASISSELPAVSVSMPCQLFFLLPSLLSAPKSKRNTPAPHLQKKLPKETPNRPHHHRRKQARHHPPMHPNGDT